MTVPHDRQMRDLAAWSDRIGYPVDVLRSAVRRGELHGERPSNWERGRIYVSTEEIERWLAEIQMSK